MRAHADIIIVGGGPVGLTLALALRARASALRASSLSVVVLEARSGGRIKDDSRTLALSYGTRLIFDRLGIWADELTPTPIESVHVSQRGGFGRTCLSAAELGVPALGYTVLYTSLNNVLYYSCSGSPIEYIDEANVTAVRSTSAYGVVEFDQSGQAHTMTASLVVLADGGKSPVADETSYAVRSKDYGESALSTWVRSDSTHRNTAYERFTDGGPIALLPAGERYALAWVSPSAQASELSQLPPVEFLRALQDKFGSRAGKFVEVGERRLIPLRLRYAAQPQGERTVLIGNAAQALHPVAAQGFNLGVRDVWALSRLIDDTPREELGDASMLKRYRSARSADRRISIGVTDFLVHAFRADNPLVRLARGAGLAALDALPPLRREFTRGMLFGRHGGV